MKDTYTNLTAAKIRLEREAPDIVDSHFRGHPAPINKGGMPVFVFRYEDTGETETRDDGVSYQTDSTRSWEIVQLLQGGGERVVEGYYCYNKDESGF